MSISTTNAGYGKIQVPPPNQNYIFTHLLGIPARELYLSALLSPAPPIVVTTTDIALTDFNFEQSLIATQLVNSAGLTAIRSLTVGPDTSANALALLTLLGITAFNHSVVLKFALDADQAAFNLLIANTSGTNTNVWFTATPAPSQILFPAASTRGTLATVYAINKTSPMTPTDYMIEFFAI